MLELVLRLGFSLAAVLGLFWLVAHLGSRRLGGTRALLHVRARQSLSRTASVAVVEVGDRVLVVGVADGGVRLLTELDPASLPETQVRLQPSEAETDAETVLAGALAGRRPARLNDRLAARVSARLARSSSSAPSHRAERSAPTVPGAGRPASAAGRGTRDQSRDRVGGLQGSVLSTQTWKQAWDAAIARHGGPENVAATAGPLDG